MENEALDIIIVYCKYAVWDISSVSTCSHNPARIVAITKLSANISELPMCSDVEELVAIRPLISCLRYTLRELMLHVAFFRFGVK